MTQLPDHHRVTRKISQLERLARQQGTVISCITSLFEALMAGQPELAAEIASLKAAVVADQASDQAVVTTLDGIIADLKAGTDTSATIAALEDVKAQITTVTSPNTPPATPPAAPTA